MELTQLRFVSSCNIREQEGDARGGILCYCFEQPCHNRNQIHILFIYHYSIPVSCKSVEIRMVKKMTILEYGCRSPGKGLQVLLGFLQSKIEKKGRASRKGSERAGRGSSEDGKGGRKSSEERVCRVVRDKILFYPNLGSLVSTAMCLINSTLKLPVE